MSVRAQLILAALCVAFGVAAAWTVQEWRHGAKYARLERDHANLLERQAHAVVETVMAAKRLEEQRVAAVEKEREHAQQMAESARADANTRAASERRLRERINTILADARSRHPALADGSSPAGSAIDMLAYVLDGALEAAGQLAEFADQSRIAGLTCERVWNQMRSETS